jgi:hypothetical protein
MNLLAGIESIQVGHTDIEDDDVRMERRRGGHQTATVRDNPHHLKLWLQQAPACVG